MPKFGKVSELRLSTCDDRLRKVLAEVIKHFDCSIVCGHRGQEEQDKAFAAGASQKKWPDSEHNKFPSLAVDAIPYPNNWTDENQMRYFAGFVVGIAATMGIKIRWGGDWNCNRDLKDQKFRDLPHFEVED